MQTITCVDCGQEKPEASFAFTKPGCSRRRRCRACFKRVTRRNAGTPTREEWVAAARARREAREAARAAERAAQPPRPMQTPEQERARWREYQRRRRATPQGQARRELQHAVERGDIKKPAACECCGQITRARDLHGHHEDYSRPLDVCWLCISCHVAAHGGEWGASRAS